jgi:transcriptional regulator with XRE-family HTH domain
MFQGNLCSPNILPMATTMPRTTQRRLGTRIQTLRHDRQLTQEQLATRAGISQKYLSELERGEKAPSWGTLVALAHHGFQIRIAALVFGIDEELSGEIRELDEVLAGRPPAVRYDVIRAVRLLLKAGEGSS